MTARITYASLAPPALTLSRTIAVTAHRGTLGSTARRDTVSGWKSRVYDYQLEDCSLESSHASEICGKAFVAIDRIFDIKRASCF